MIVGPQVDLGDAGAAGVEVVALPGPAGVEVAHQVLHVGSGPSEFLEGVADHAGDLVEVAVHAPAISILPSPRVDIFSPAEQASKQRDSLSGAFTVQDMPRDGLLICCLDGNPPEATGGPPFSPQSSELGAEAF